MAYQYVREAAPNASVLKLGLVHPLPRKLIEAFAQRVARLYVIEELEPLFETQIRAWGVEAVGKALTGLQGELSVRKLRAIFGDETPPPFEAEALPVRAPVMCAGCPHRGPFYVLGKLKKHVTGDIGCYTLGSNAPLSAIDTTICMGASVGMAQGFERARGSEFGRETVAVIGDSTFLHSGVTGLMNAVYNRTPLTVMILDNRITGMTGHQPNPATGYDIRGNATTRIDLEALCRACGVARVVTVDAGDLRAIERAVVEETGTDEVSVIIARRPCALLDKKTKHPPYEIDARACRNCRACLKVGCPAIARGDGGAVIDRAQCTGCGLCAQVCGFAAIKRAGEQ
jgi:indolepyruvate ferredoxin oxidoreductase alpha subunit